MAIKVRHDGNQTASLAASGEGGKAKRQQQDALAAMQVAQSAANAGNQQLRGASAPGASVQLTHAQLTHAQAGGHGAPTQMIHAPTPPGMRYGGGGSTRGAGTGGGGTGGASDYYALGNSPTTRPDNPNAKWVWTNPEQTQGEWRVPLTAQGRKERNALVNDIIKGVQSGRFSQTEIDSLMGQFKDAEDRIRVADMMREPELSSEEKFNQNTFTNKDGLIFKTDGTLVYDPNKNSGAETPQQKQERVAQERKDKWLDDRIKILTSPRKGQVKDKFGNVTESMVDGLSYQDAYDQAQDEMKIRFPEPAPVPQKKPTTGDPALGGGYVEMADTLDRAEILADGKIGVTRGYKPPSFGNRARLNPYSPIGDAIPSQPVPTPTPTQTDEIKKKWAQYAD